MMDSFKGGATDFGFHRGMGEADDFSGVLDVYVHHARNIHNICIYANQDVYAKFSLTCSPDEALSTRIVAGGGKNPQFDERLQIKITHPDAVLKCEIWMMSCARNYMEDQLLGFALVPLSLVASADGRLTQDFSLSSTDLIHSPAGTVHLSLSLDTSLPLDPKAFAESNRGSSISSEVVLLDPAEYGRIEFPDIGVVRENQQMVSEYFDMTTHLGASSQQSMEDYEMTTVNSGDETNGGSASPDGSIHNSGVFSSSTTTSLSDDRNSVDSVEKKRPELPETNKRPAASPETPTSKSRGVSEEKDSKASSKEEGEGSGKEGREGSKGELDSVFKSPMGNINLEAEQSAMQQQIVDMYMRSMQQFTESLAKMKLPMDLDNPQSEDGGDVIQCQNNKLQPQKKGDGSRVFYGSRAFF